MINLREKIGAKHVVVLGAEPQSLINFRKDLIEELVRNGRKVTVISATASPEQISTLAKIGAQHLAAHFSRAGMNPILDVRTVFSLLSIFRKIRPDLIIAYTAKPVIFGGLAARLAGSLPFVSMITGLGYAFIEGPEKKRHIARFAAEHLYKISLRFSKVVIFQNRDDQETFRSIGILRYARATGVVNGSGVNTSYFAVTALPNVPVFLMIARLLRDKGVREYAQAAEVLRRGNPDTRTLLLGALDPSPNSISRAELDQWIANGLEYICPVSDVRPAISEASVIVLPSYREGTPRSVLEGMAMGRAIITTDAPGCRETVRQGVNGLLVPPRDSDLLADAMMKLATDKKLVVRMGAASRAFVKEKFEASTVAKDVIRLSGL